MKNWKDGMTFAEYEALRPPPIDQRDLPTQLDDLASRQTRTKGTPSETERLLRLAAAEIRRLQERLDAAERSNTLLLIDVEAEAGL
jgi:hypothetical protein